MTTPVLDFSPIIGALNKIFEAIGAFIGGFVDAVKVLAYPIGVITMIGIITYGVMRIWRTILRPAWETITGAIRGLAGRIL